MPQTIVGPSESIFKDGRVEAGRLLKPTRFFYETADAMTDYRFERTLQTSDSLTIDNHSSLVFFSDTHRGDGGLLDRFAPNEALFLRALHHYAQKAFTYVEVGDGDELWQVDHFADIQAAHPHVFSQLERFQRLGRLHMIVGNHDVGRDPRLAISKAGLPLKRGLKLHHRESGRHLFVTHGHQADMQSGYFARMLCRYIGRPFQEMARNSVSSHSKFRSWVKDVTVTIEAQVDERAGQLEQRIKRWANYRPNVFTICGHTHTARFRWHNYFNTGSCLEPGVLTGIEISGGHIRQIRWSETDGRQIIFERSLAD